MEVMVSADCTAVVRRSAETPGTCFCCGADLSRKSRVDESKIILGDLAFQCRCGETRHIQYYEHDGRSVRPGKRVCPGCDAQSPGPRAFREVRPKAA